ncbi:hypothetical protein CFC21_090256 [Triticum aestivum]|uniref:LOB domain-containing protein n=2 Tax=Triticum aestivum TaxID=4565 RepID=A0A3B6PTX7_WHEAT|nr:LOB domain-containing protein 16-like [Triticum aestivum]KAF7087033.1 hypothetical protein CFC21_090256 [Triticum aestivum]
MAAAAGGGAGGGVAGVAGSPCGACKFLRRRCVAECVFAPYFSSEQGAARFAAIHKVFGASNAAKLLAHLPLADRCEAVVTITYEAQSRLRDPVYGCVAQIFALQQQVAILQAQLMQARAQIACGAQSTTSPVSHHQPQPWLQDTSIAALLRQQENGSSFAAGGALLPELMSGDVSMLQQHCGGKVEGGGGGGAGDLQYLAQAMMRSSNYSL